jgi:NitT/TauT family transport system permease protein
MIKIPIHKILPHVAFVILATLVLTPSLVEPENRWVFFGTIVLAEAVLIFYHKSRTANDIASALFIALILWEVTSSKLPNPLPGWYPTPEDVFKVFPRDWKTMVRGIGRSFGLLFQAFILAHVLGIGLGIIVGWVERLRNVVLPIAKILSPIPSIVYIPYSIAILPTFRSASIFVIFTSMFWGLFIIIIVTVSNVDHKVMESAKTLNTRPIPMILQILLPYCLPRILDRMNNTLSGAFVVLMAAEMIGANSGLGYYVRRAGDFGDYNRVIAGIIVIAVMITLLNKILLILQKLLLRWH